MSESTAVLIIASPGRLRDGLRVLLRASARVAQIVQADDLPSGLQQIVQSPPDLVLLDADLPDGQTWEAVRQIRQCWPECGCVVLAHTTHQERMARSSGATAVLPDGFSTEALFNVITRYKGVNRNENLS
jgi:DNA-binding NarL/FixJ family response regulator